MLPLNPAQHGVIALLGRSADDRPPPRAELAAELEAELFEAMEIIRDEAVAGPEMWIGKRDLALINGCETHYVAEQANDFNWTPASARGVVAHKAIELALNWRGDVAPAEMVDEALARLGESAKGVSTYINRLTEGERAELRGFATDRATKFMECFPPLKAKWRPVTESSVVVELLDGHLKLGGKTDLTLGEIGQKVIIDLKSGGSASTHREDLRFYALLETIRSGRPPRKVATYYLDSARAHAEDVSEGMLQSALRRTIDGVMRIIELDRRADQPTKRPAVHCRWCPLLDSCAEGTAHLARVDDPDVNLDVW